ncbi:MAG: ThuA domain-containing protein [Saonia sp.]
MCFPKKVTLLLLLSLFIFSCESDQANDAQEESEEQEEMDDEITSEQLLIFTKTDGFRHASIADGVATFKDLGMANDFSVTQTENASDFTPENLQKYQLVVFLSTTRDVLKDDQQAAFENYIKSGGSFMGIHAATDTEYDWPWYGQLVGAYFNGHPNVQEAAMDVLVKDHASTSHLADTWTRRDEWYNFRDINPAINVLMNLDENSYDGGENGADHPIAWYHEFDGGRSFYTAGGHTEESFSEPDFREHLLGGVLYCLGRD